MLRGSSAAAAGLRRGGGRRFALAPAIASLVCIPGFLPQACSGFTMPALVVRARAPRVHSRTRAHACVWREMDGGGAAGASRATAVSAVTPARALPGALCRHRRVPAQVSLSGPAPAAVFVAARERVPAGGEGGRAGVLPRPGPTLRDSGRAAQGDAVPSSVCPRARRALTPARAHGR